MSLRLIYIIKIDDICVKLFILMMEVHIRFFLPLKFVKKAYLSSS